MLLQPTWIASGLSNKQWLTRVEAASSDGSVDLMSGSTDTTATNHFHYACRGHASGFAATAVFGSNTPLFGAIDAFDAVAVVTGLLGASAC